MVNDGCPVQRAGRFDERLNDLSSGLEQVEKAISELETVNGALELVLQLLKAAHATALLGDHLHCLLAPLQAKMARSLDQMDEVL